MIKTFFKLPETKLCTVVWFRNGARNETLIPTPSTNDSLVRVMFEQHRVGASEIRTVKSLEPAGLIGTSF